MSTPTILSFGGGVNSAAMLVGLLENGERPDAILFADTGGEKPHTYEFVRGASEWCVRNNLPEIVVVQNDGMYASLEDNCLRKGMLPSLAYGFKSCSDKYKKRPQEKWAKSWQPAVDCWAGGGKVVKFIGFDAGEERRAKIPEDKHYTYRYPLLEWGWEREDCLAAIARAGLPNPGKSACFFCPASKKAEVLELKRRYPELAQRAIEMERNADLDTVKGLGRAFSWEAFLSADERQGRLFPEVIDEPCMCFDGEGVE